MVNMLRVKPHAGVGALPVPMGDGTRLSAANCPAEGLLVQDSLYIRRRVMFSELVIVAEGEAALPPRDVIPAKAMPPQPIATKGSAP